MPPKKDYGPALGLGFADSESVRTRSTTITQAVMRRDRMHWAKEAID